MMELKKRIKMFICIFIVINLMIFLVACSLFNIRFKRDKEEDVVGIQEEGELSVNTISSISNNRMIQEDILNKNDKSIREYVNFFSLRDADLEYIDNAAYEELKEVLEQVDWYPQFELGEEEELEFHLQKYRELLLMEREYVNRANGEQATLDHLISRQINEPDASYLYYDMESNNYYIYDFDGDGAQELCIELIAPVSIYVFKYDKRNDEVYLWSESGSSSQLGGRRTVFSGDGRPEYMTVLDESGNPENIYMNYCGFKNIIAIPCKNGQGGLMVSDMLYENSYQIEDEDGRGYFYVTEEQFQTLAQHMWDGRAWAEKEIKKYQYTYNDLILE